jgi:autotransporter translocation and assembly factor TamB
MEGRRGEVFLSVTQGASDRYDSRGAFVLDSLCGCELRVEEATLDIDSLAWRLVRPAEARWDRTGITLRDVAVDRADDGSVSVNADGRLAWEGSSDLRVSAVGLSLDRVARVAQLPDSLVSGTLDFSLQVDGPASDPLIGSTFRIQEPRYARLSLSELSGSLDYGQGLAEVSLDALDGVRRVFHATGPVPVDLSFRPEGSRVSSLPMDVRVVADSLAAAVALSYVGLLEDVEGRVSGEFHIRGTLDRPEPSGQVRLDDGAWSIDALGVRHQAVEGTLVLTPDRTVQVSLGTQAAGTSTVEGQVILDPVTNPRLDLAIAFNDFEAVNRRDVAGHISGQTRLQGTYREPFLEGSLTVDHGTLFLEEFARSAQVVDLTDPRIFDLVVDTAVFSTRPLLAGINNPFLQNLRVAVDLSVPRDTWLRSEDMNVEIGGELLVSYDRVQRDLVMVGELQALRGSYLVLGRRFEVEEGVVGFIGIPGINPTLSIQAVSRIRRVEGDPLNVSATVSGTLTQPRVTLSSDEQGVAESDLVSYLIFGRPSYELASGQEALVQGAAGSLVRTTAGAGVTWATGTLANQLGAAVAQQIGVDYLSITQAGDFGVLTGSFASSLAGTQIEIGQYLGEDVFFVLLFRPRPEPGTGRGYFGGARLEVALTDDYNVQGFWEDRFLRGRAGAFGDLPFQAAQVLGVFIFREWGY